MKEELLCFDVDGTLRDNVHHQISSSTMKCLQLLKDYGYRMIISTGRGVDSLKRTGLMDLDFWDGYVCNNGQDVLDKDENILVHEVIPSEVVIETIKTANELGYAVVLKGSPRIITKEPDEYVLESQRFFNNVIPDVGDYHGQEVQAMIVYGPKGYDYAPFFKIPHLTVLPGESTYADLTLEGVSKATGIKEIMKHYDLKSYIAFGDSLNDQEMFKHASMSIAMGQGNETLKSMASFVTKSIDEDGIAYACYKLGLIKEKIV